MKKLLLMLSVWCVVMTMNAADILVETESFQHKGGWLMDQQFMGLMGSPYLLAHGLGIPVEDAVTRVEIPEDGRYRVYVRTYNWTSPWTSKKGPGAFQLVIDDKFHSPELGTRGNHWSWQEAGTVKLKKGESTFVLHDLKGFDGRCDAILLTTSNSLDPNSPTIDSSWRRTLLHSSNDGEALYDFVVVGGGIAGMCSAVAAARHGLKVALVQDRKVLGGNNSSEVRVHLSGISEVGKFPRLGRMIREFGHTHSGNAMTADRYEDQKKDSFILNEKNVTLYSGYRATDVQMDRNRIGSVTIENTESAARMKLFAPLFSDCTGDGSLGVMAGADYAMGREARYVYNENMAPIIADSLVMGSSLQWYSVNSKKPVVFPEFNYGTEINSQNAQYVERGEWTWETGMNKNQITEAEQIRDYGLLVVYNNWSYLKNHSKNKDTFSNRKLDWLAYVLGKRESRRLLGDHVLTQNDLDNNIEYRDASFCTTWAIDLHFPDPDNTKYFPGEEFKTKTVHNWIYPYNVPYRCLYSRNVSNLFMAGRDISCSHVALGTIRVMRTTGMMGEVTGLAASVCNKHACTPRQLYEKYFPELEHLMEQGAGKDDAPDTQKFNGPNKNLLEPKTFSSLNAYAHLDGDTLKIGNQLIERTFMWNGGDLRTMTLLNKKTGRLFETQGKDPDLLIVKGIPSNGKLETSIVLGNTLHPAYLLAEVTYNKGELEIKRQYKIYDNVPAIACNTWLKGHLQAETITKEVQSVDRKNIESKKDMEASVKVPILDRLQLHNKHWQMRTVEFQDYTDWNNNLVKEQRFVPYRESNYRGNLLIAKDNNSGGGFFLLKESPCSSSQLEYPGYDFRIEYGDVKVCGLGLSGSDVNASDWTPTYGVIIGVNDGSERDALLSLHTYQKQSRLYKRSQDEMVMLNTWGDRSQDSKINNAFCLQELDKADRLGITVFQMDDGWQRGKSPNSKVTIGSFKDIWQQKDYWMPDTVKFPNGLTEIVSKADSLGIRIGLWFNPSIQNDFADWQKDAEAILSLWHQYGICIFKIDGLQIPTKKAEMNLRNLFDYVQKQSGGDVMFNLDATAGRRGGYIMFNEYGNIFLENRYTDWGNYYPYQTLRNLWLLSRYIPSERIQTEFLNKWRNTDKYPLGDRFAPSNYSFGYLFGITIAGQPLAWMEASNLPSEAYDATDIIKTYRQVQEEFHKGCILPIGEEPNGCAWTGFQSMLNDSEGFLLIYREDNEQSSCQMQTWFKLGDRILLQPLFHGEDVFESNVGEDGKIQITIQDKNQFQLYRYRRI